MSFWQRSIEGLRYHKEQVVRLKQQDATKEDLTSRWSQLRKFSRAGWPHCGATAACLPRHPAVAYLFLARPMPLTV